MVHVSDISLVANHLPGYLNSVADRESRVTLDRWDWQLHPKIFIKINNLWGPLTIDLFVSRLTHHLLVYFSWRPDGCFSSGLVREDELCKPPLGSTVENPIRGQQPTSRGNISGPSLEGSVMISSPVHACQFPHLILPSTCPIFSQQSMPPTFEP